MQTVLSLNESSSESDEPRQIVEKVNLLKPFGAGDVKEQSNIIENDSDSPLGRAPTNTQDGKSTLSE